jgi:hypothetical protein
VVALNGTAANGVSVHNKWLAPLAFPIQDLGNDCDGATYVDIQEIETPRNAASEVESQPWPAPDSLEVQRARLVSEIADANGRAANLRAVNAIRQSELKAALRAEFVVARRALGDMEREHEARIVEIRAAAQADVERILADARRTVGASDDD